MKEDMEHCIAICHKSATRGKCLVSTGTASSFLFVGEIVIKTSSNTPRVTCHILAPIQLQFAHVKEHVANEICNKKSSLLIKHVIKCIPSFVQLEKKL